MQNLFLINDWNYRACYKNSAIKTLKLKQLSQTCDNLLWWIDYLRLVSLHSDLLIACPCFAGIVNDSNSAQNTIKGSELDWCPFDFVNIALTKVGKVSQYMVSVSYKEQSINVCRFTFYGSKEGSLMSQIDIYWKAWRLQSAMNNEFLIDNFVRSLIMWWIDEDDDLYDDIQVAFFSYYFTRLDFRIDFWSKNKKLVPIHPYDLTKRKMKGKGTRYDEDGKSITDMFVGTPENNYIFIRFLPRFQS